ncbi:M24 family metallopeptidase [Schlesneria paludicola]|uniref:M24 family metallopeptidase n=1 Tax=Schlesneria paludicola TaxID=360056 RepID=UPI00029AE04B|nr:Xaa-Pro peptidase family protein [Schlesneria paludicola]
MLTKAGCLARRARLWENLPSSCEWVLVADPRHVYYLSNFWIHPLTFSAGERCWLLLEREGKATLLGDNFSLRSRAGEPFADDEVMVKWYDHKHSVINRDHALLKAAEQIADRLYGRVGAVEAEWLPVGAFELLGLDHEQHSVRLEAADVGRSNAIDLGTTLRSLRRQKHDDEIALLKECMRAGEAGMLRLREIIRPGISEFEIFCEVQRAAIGAAGRPGLIYGDFRAASPSKPKVGGLPTDHKLEPGEMFTLDYSVVLDGYRSDFTNCLTVGEPNAQQKHLYDLVSAAQRGGEAVLKAGTLAKDVFNAVNKPILDAGLADKFAHHAGHGIGMAHPEAPILVPDSEDVLMAGDVITLEPGLYVEGIGGIRIEHNYLITETGYERLSNHVISLT